MIDRIGGRKFFGFLLVLGLATVVQIYSSAGVSAAYASLLTGALAVFAGANAYVTARSPFAEPAPQAVTPSAEPTETTWQVDEQEPSAPAPAAPALDVETLKADVVQLQNAVIGLGQSVQATNNLLRTMGIKASQ